MTSKRLTGQSEFHMASPGRKTSKLFEVSSVCATGTADMWDNNSDDEGDGEYLVWPRPLRISEHLTHVSLSSLWELWLNDNN